ncbi:hypothetical protein HX99_00105 [Peptococcaceae bacterium SCADC1_2_3]|nr:hypothetical protein DK28_0212285 [Peptococcaceae bacterium SCADC1_2_3]KFI34468.1 hypothetical protein HY00_01585 [Peptococcaceae bacterium SCADC1_2_3]KFI37123.1 hypothetical protein HX99_00105 [Peptococcaceae bacterium SCADC1_2_3]KFI37249.1 hypothetical protein HY02_08850 [Peptococcaceae bacterium SCADC1_2_3]
MKSTAEKASELERAMMELVYQSRLTEMKIKQLAEEMIDFKDEMRASKKEMDKKWGELAKKMGTLIEDIFIPSLDLTIEKYFNVTPYDVMPRRKVRKNGKSKTMEIDILALADNQAFVVEVKASPNRLEYVYDFIEKLQTIPDFIPEIKNYKVIPIYAALDMEESTINLLTKNNIYAMILRGDILEIVNFKDLS